MNSPKAQPRLSSLDIVDFSAFQWLESHVNLSLDDEAFCYSSYSSEDKQKTNVRFSEKPPAIVLVEVEEVDEKDDEEWKPDLRIWMIFGALSTILFACALDATILVSSLPAIAKALNASATSAFWIGTSYLLASATFQPLVSSLADLFGRKWLLFAAVIFFTLGTVICCAAHDIVTLLCGRAVQGIGGGGIFAMNLIILSDIVPLRQRAKYTGYIQLVFSVGTILGPVVGGVFAQHTDWHWIFYVNLPFCALGLVITPFVIKYQNTIQVSRKEKIKSIDWIGSGMFVTSMTSFLIGISWGGTQFPWNRAATLVPLLVGLTGIVATIFWEEFGASRPFLRVQVFHNVSAIIAFICTVLQGLLLYANLYYIAFWLTVVKDRSPTATGIGLLPICCLMIPTSAVIGALITRFGRFRWAVWGGWIVTLAANGFLIVLKQDTSTVCWAAALLMVGLGHGFLLISLNLAIQAITASVNPANAPSAAAMYSFMRSLGLCLGVATGGTIFTNMLSTRLSFHHLPLAIGKNAEGFVSILKKMPSRVPPGLDAKAAQKVAQKVMEKHLILESYQWAFQHLFIVLTGIAGVGCLMSFFIRSYSMDLKVKDRPKLSLRDAHRRSSII